MHWESREKWTDGKKQASFKGNDIQKPSPIICVYHASETDLIKMAWDGGGRGMIEGQAGNVSTLKHKAAHRLSTALSFQFPHFKREERKNNTEKGFAPFAAM